MLKGRQDRFRLLLPDDTIPDEIKEKYTKILIDKKNIITNPIDFVNESIQRCQVLGFNGATLPQPQARHGLPTRDSSRLDENMLLGRAVDYQYRSVDNPVQIIDRTLNIDFRHTVGFLNYFIMFESFFYIYSRDTKSDKIPSPLSINIMNEFGEIYSRIMLYDPVIEGMDMLDLDFTQPVASSQSFRVTYKYSNIDFQFIETDPVTEKIEIPVLA